MNPRGDPGEIERRCRAAAGGDADALQRLMLHYHGELLAFLRRKLGGEWGGKIDPEEVLQETYVEILAHVAGFSYSGEDSFYVWALRIAERRFIDRVRYWRAGKRAAQREARPAPQTGSRYENLIERVSTAGHSPSAALRRDDAIRIAMSCLARLPEEYRRLIERLHLGQETVAQLAAETGKSPAAVHRMAGRALEKLRACMGRASEFLESRA